MLVGLPLEIGCATTAKYTSRISKLNSTKRTFGYRRNPLILQGQHLAANSLCPGLQRRTLQA
jgi:hypothetical protein